MILSRPLAALLLTGAALIPTMAAPAADPPVQTRVDRLEKEMRAVQRKVFPGGAPAFSEPEIAAPPAASAAGTPAGQPLNELSERVGSLERELARLTNQVEQDEHRLQLLSEGAARDRAEVEVRLKALEAGQTSAAAPAAADAPPPRPGRGAKARPAPVPAADEETTPPSSPSPATATRAPAPTGDKGEDAYMAAYQLWTDKRYDEATAALQKVAKDYPKHKRASYARNLAGRSALDGGKPATAAQIFLQNYQAEPKGERAPDSLFYLGQALTELKKTDNACRAYDELQAVYGATMQSSLKARLPAARKSAGCKPAAG